MPRAFFAFCVYMFIICTHKRVPRGDFSLLSIASRMPEVYIYTCMQKNARDVRERLTHCTRNISVRTAVSCQTLRHLEVRRTVDGDGRSAARKMRKIIKRRWVATTCERRVLEQRKRRGVTHVENNISSSSLLLLLSLLLGIIANRVIAQQFDWKPLDSELYIHRASERETDKTTLTALSRLSISFCVSGF